MAVSPDPVGVEWWENLTPDQLALYGGYIDSEVRLLGKPYGAAVRSVRANGRIRAEVLAIGADDD